MCSTTLQKLINPDAAEAVIAAVEAVAERSFFTVVDRCPEKALTAMAASVPEWLIATVRFEDGPFHGWMSCLLPDELARSLFDSFSGREPSEAAPAERELYDLVGEFTNMVCGAWLTRCVTDRAFRLSPPLVARIGAPALGAAGRVWVGVGTRPVAVDVCLQPQLETLPATVSA